MQKTILKTFGHEDETESIIEFAGDELDKLLNNEILKEIPVIKTLMAFANIGFSISDKLFFGKMKKFLDRLNDMSKMIILEEIMKIDASRKYRHKAGETLCYIIDKCSDAEDMEMIAILFKAYINGLIVYEEFCHLRESSSQCPKCRSGGFLIISTNVSIPKIPTVLFFQVFGRLKIQVYLEIQNQANGQQNKTSFWQLVAWGY